MVYQSMGKSEPFVSSALPSIDMPPSTKETIQGDLQVLRRTFRDGKLRSIEARKRILRQIQTAITEGAPLLEEACLLDLHKHPTELYMMELSHVHHDLQEHLDHLEDWAKPEKVSTNLVNLPGSSSIVSDPLGVCCIIDTWNYPVSLLFLPLIGCIGAGNCALVRLPPQGTSDHTAAVIASLLDKYVDSDVVRYVAGGIDANIAMLQEKYDLIFATGGTTIGKIVARAAAETLTPIVLELGGKSPCIVDEDVDIDVAATRVAWGAFANCGQTCIRPDYLLVNRKIGDKFVSLIKERVESFFGVKPQSSDSYGRLVNAGQFNRLAKIVEADKKFVIHGGDVDSNDRFLSPTVLNFKTDKKAFETSASMEGELFGPVLPVYYYNDLNEVLEFVKDRPKPLALYAFSTNTKLVQTILDQTTSGSVNINDTMTHITNGHLPFGGVGNSGMGAYHGKHSFRTFSHQKAVMWKSTFLDIPQRYMPYTPNKTSFMRLSLRPITRFQFRAATAGAIVALIAIVWAIVWSSL